MSLQRAASPILLLNVTLATLSNVLYVFLRILFSSGVDSAKFSGNTITCVQEFVTRDTLEVLSNLVCITRMNDDAYRLNITLTSREMYW